MMLGKALASSAPSYGSDAKRSRKQTGQAKQPHMTTGLVLASRRMYNGSPRQGGTMDAVALSTLLRWNTLAWVALGLLILVVLLKTLRYIPNTRVGIVEKLASSRGSVKKGLVALEGEAGFQPELLRGGWHVHARSSTASTRCRWSPSRRARSATSSPATGRICRHPVHGQQRQGLQLPGRTRLP
jgi:hypothetical protein